MPLLYIRLRWRLVTLLGHLVVVSLSYVLAWLLRFDFAIPASELPLLKKTLLAVVIAKLVVFVMLRHHLQPWWRHQGFSDMLRLLRNKALASVGSAVAIYSIAGNAFRPGDVFKTRKGLTVEIGNTDAEGRLVLCEALALADEESPELIIDMATLTGAARVALGPDLSPFYTDDDDVAQELAKHALKTNDPVWRMPLWRPYNALIETPIADINNAGAGGFGGSITAALFLRRFVEKAGAHVHFDIFAWVPTAKPGRPKGGEQQGMRALFSYLSERYGA